MTKKHSEMNPQKTSTWNCFPKDSICLLWESSLFSHVHFHYKQNNHFHFCKEYQMHFWNFLLLLLCKKWLEKDKHVPLFLFRHLLNKNTIFQLRGEMHKIKVTSDYLEKTHHKHEKSTILSSIKVPWSVKIVIMCSSIVIPSKAFPTAIFFPICMYWKMGIFEEQNHSYHQLNLPNYRGGLKCLNYLACVLLFGRCNWLIFVFFFDSCVFLFSTCTWLILFSFSVVVFFLSVVVTDWFLFSVSVVIL